MVALQILVLSVEVRIPLSQPNENPSESVSEGFYRKLSVTKATLCGAGLCAGAEAWQRDIESGHSDFQTASEQ